MCVGIPYLGSYERNPWNLELKSNCPVYIYENTSLAHRLVRLLVVPTLEFDLFILYLTNGCSMWSFALAGFKANSLQLLNSFKWAIIDGGNPNWSWKSILNCLGLFWMLILSRCNLFRWHDARPRCLSDDRSHQGINDSHLHHPSQLHFLSALKSQVFSKSMAAVQPE